MYKTLVLDYCPKSRDMAIKIEHTANKMHAEGYELVTFSETTTAKAILVFKKIIKQEY